MAMPTAVADRIGELARRMGVPRTMLEDMPPETLDRLGHCAARIETEEAEWGDLADLIAGKLAAAGFRRHDPLGQRGGFQLSLWEDGVIVTWSVADYRDDAVSLSPFEEMVEHAMYPALEQILQASSFAAHIIPEGEDNGGSIRVTGWQGASGMKAAAEH